MAYRQAIEILESMSDDSHVRGQLEDVRYHFGMRLWHPWGRPVEALPLLLQSLDYAQERHSLSPDSKVEQRFLADVLLHVGAVQHTLHDDAAEATLHSSLEHFEILNDRFEDDADYPFGIARTNKVLAQELERKGQLRSAEEAYLRAKDVLEKSLQRWPNSSAMMRYLGGTVCEYLANLLESQERFEEAITVRKQAVEVTQQLARSHPYGNFPITAARVAHRFASLLTRLGRHAEAVEYITQLDPESMRDSLIRAEIFSLAGNYTQAVADFERARRDLGPYATETDQNDFYRAGNAIGARH